MADNAFANAINQRGFVNYNGQQVLSDDAYMQQLASGAQANGMSPLEYDKLMNPNTYGARWGGETTPVTGNVIDTSPQPASGMQIPTSQSYQVPTYQSPEFNFEVDPGYAFRKAEGEKALQSRQLASGNFFSGGAMKEIADYNGGLASQEYGNAFQRYLDQDAIGFRNNNTAYDRNWNEGQRDYNRWTDDYNRTTTADNTNWDRLKYLDTAGINATGTGVNAGQSTANNVSNLTTNAGNAQSNGYINSNNAWTNALGNALYSMRSY